MANSVFIFPGSISVTPGNQILGDGSAAAPTVASQSTPNTGIFFPSSGAFIALSKSGTPKLLVATSEVFLGRDLAFGWANTVDPTSGIIETRMLRTGLGIIQMDDSAGSFNRLMFGGATAAFPSIKRNAAALQARLADDSAEANVECASISTSSVVLHTTRAALTNNAAAQTATLTNGPTAGNPTKWIPINDNGTTRNIPAW